MTLPHGEDTRMDDLVIELKLLQRKINGDGIYNSTDNSPYSHQMENFWLCISVYIQNEPYRLVEQISLVESEEPIKAVATF